MMPDRKSFADEVSRIVKIGGRILVIDWKDSFGGMGPKENVLFPAEHAAKLFEHYGFKVVKNIEAGEHHYGIIMVK